MSFNSCLDHSSKDCNVSLVSIVCLSLHFMGIPFVDAPVSRLQMHGKRVFSIQAGKDARCCMDHRFLFPLKGFPPGLGTCHVCMFVSVLTGCHIFMLRV